MEAWSNIQISPQDPEITKINNLEKKLGELSDKVTRIRALITRFEICHFKYRQHLKNIKDSIIKLEPNVDSTKIGRNHIQHGESVWKLDSTGKSLTGQQYIWAIREWLNDNFKNEVSDNYDEKLGQQIHKWLGKKSPDKIRLTRLLLARLTWDWKLYGELQLGGEFKDIELQACRMDICHYAFPENLNLLLQGIGQMKPVTDTEFKGCGSYDDDIKAYIKKEFSDLNSQLQSFINAGKSDKNELIKAWLIACLAKTIKEDVNLTIPIVDLAID